MVSTNVDLLRIYFLLVISRNHSNRVKYHSKGYLFWYQDFARFTQVVVHYMFFYKHIKLQGLGSDMLIETQNIGWKYAYDMLILWVKIINFNSTFYVSFEAAVQICSFK